MNEDDLRALVRRVVADRLAAGGDAHSTPSPGVLDLRTHPSHGVLRVLAGAEIGGPCLIEPLVPCNHCGYCQSFGH